MTGGTWSSWRTAIRIAGREARRAKGRSALVIALIGLPTLGLSFAAVTYDSFRLTPQQQIDREIGAADALVRWEYDGPTQQNPKADATIGGRLRTKPATEQELLRVLPPGSRVTPVEDGYVDVVTPAGVGSVGAHALDLTDPLLAGRVELRSGRAPAVDDEVAMTAHAAARLSVALGDPVTTADGTASYTVVGIVEFPGHLWDYLVFRPGAMPEQPWARPPAWLLDAPHPVTWEQVKELNQHGMVVRSRAVALHPPPDNEVHPELVFADSGNDRVLEVGALIAGLALLEVVLLAGPAFAVGARRRQRELALVAAAGGTPAHQRRIVLADGVVLGAAGAMAGLLIGVVLAVALRPVLAEYLWHARPGGYRFFPLALLGSAGLAVVTGVAAAAVPAVIASRQPVVASLAGRRGVTRSRARWVMLGLGMTAFGGLLAAWGAWQVAATVILAGLAISQLGLVLCTPALLGLIARLGRRVPLTVRVSLRDTARNRAAAAPAISAVMAAVAGSLALGIFLVSDSSRHEMEYLPVVPVGSAVVQYEQWSYSAAAPPVRELLDEARHDDVRTVATASLRTTRLYDVSVPACPADSSADECVPDVVLPPEHECPAWKITTELTIEQQREAVADERCRMRNAYMNLTIASTVVDDGALLPVLTGAAPDEVAAAREVLAAGGVVVSDPLLLREGYATVEIHEVEYPENWDEWHHAPAAEEPEPRRVTLPGYALTTATGPDVVFLSPAALVATGLQQEVIALVAHTDTAPTEEQQDAMRAALRDIDPELTLYVENGPQSRSDPELLILAVVAGLIALGAAGIATGLAAADRRQDLATLAAVGASPRVRRLLSLSHSGVIAGLGTVLGAVAGVGAAFAVLVALNQRDTTIWPPTNPYPIFVPWAELALLLTVPLVAMLGAGLLTRSRLPIERRPT